MYRKIGMLADWRLPLSFEVTLSPPGQGHQALSVMPAGAQFRNIVSHLVCSCYFGTSLGFVCQVCVSAERESFHDFLKFLKDDGQPSPISKNLKFSRQS